MTIIKSVTLFHTTNWHGYLNIKYTDGDGHLFFFFYNKTHNNRFSQLSSGKRRPSFRSPRALSLIVQPSHPRNRSRTLISSRCSTYCLEVINPINNDFPIWDRSTRRLSKMQAERPLCAHKTQTVQLDFVVYRSNAAQSLNYQVQRTQRSLPPTSLASRRQRRLKKGVELARFGKLYYCVRADNANKT